MPLFYGNKDRMQTRVQLIDAKDHNGNRLPNSKAFDLLKTALKIQSNNTQVVIMPPLSSHQTFKLINRLNNATTLGCGRKSHKVTREHLNQNNNVIMNIGNVDMKPRTPKEHKIVKNLCDIAVDRKISINERNLKIQLLVSKLNTVLSKRIDRNKYSAFNTIKLYNMKSQSIDRIDRNFEYFSANTTKTIGNAKGKLLRFGTDSEYK